MKTTIKRVVLKIIIIGYSQSCLRCKDLRENIFLVSGIPSSQLYFP